MATSAKGRRLNIGCGPYQKPAADGWINLDKNPQQKPDIVRDVRKGLPFDSGSVDEVLASHFLEHLQPDDMLDLLEEIYRVLKPGGTVTVVVPLGVTGCLDHYMAFTERSFDVLFLADAGGPYFNREFRWSKVSSRVRSSPEPEHPWDELHITMRAEKPA